MNTAVSTENARATPMESFSAKALARRASCSSPIPSSRETSDPPPMPARPARQSVMLNMGSISDVPATMYGLFV